MSDEIRSEVVDAVVKALTAFDPSALEGLDGITPAERAAAESLWREALEARRSHSKDYLKVWEIFIEAGVDLSTKPSWSQIFDLLSVGQVNRLHDLYYAMDEGGRVEFDRRWGRPDL